MAPSRRKSRHAAEKPKAQSCRATLPACTPCYVRLERCPDISTTGRCFVRGESGSGPLPATWRVPYRKDPVIIDVWSLHPNASWRRKTAKTYGKKDIPGRHLDAFDNATTGTLEPDRLAETCRKQSIKPTGAECDRNGGVAVAGCPSDHPDPKRVKRTDVKVGKNHTELLQEGILMRREIEKKNVAKRATTEAELKPNVTGQPSPCANAVTVKTESDARPLISDERRPSQRCVGDPLGERTTSQEPSSRPVSELNIKSEPANEQISTAGQQTEFETSRGHAEVKQVKREEGRVEEEVESKRNIKEDSLAHARLHAHINSAEGDSLQKAVVNKGDTILLSRIQGGKAMVRVQRAVKRRHARGKRSRKRPADDDQQAETHCCRFCSKTFSGKQYLRIHQEKRVCCTSLSCKTCGKKFANKLGMFQHSKTHTQVKPYSCGHCDRRFRWVSKLKLHLIMHKDKAVIKNVCCSSCEWLTLPGALAIMELRRKSSYICKTCGKGFQLRMDGEPFQCQECNSVFASMASLSGHRRSHKKTLFECAECGEHFESVYLVQKHREKYHPSERPYICKQCGEKFPRKSGLETHQLGHEDQWSIPSPSPNRMNDVEEEGEMEELMDSLSKDNDFLTPVKDGERLEPVMLNPVKEEPCTFSILEPYQIKTESEEMPCYPFNSIKTESDDAFW